jgi:hypothetical protein
VTDSCCVAGVVEDEGADVDCGVYDSLALEYGDLVQAPVMET